MARIIPDRVLETSTSTGTGDFTLAGASTGFKAFSDECSIGDTFEYTIEAVDLAGRPTGDWENGLGTYSATDTLTRTTVLESTNGNAAVNFAAGLKKVYIGRLARSLKMFDLNEAGELFIGNSGTTQVSTKFLKGSTELARFAPTTNNLLIGTTTDDGSSKLQVNGSGVFSSNLSVAGVSLLSNGSAGLPAYSFTSDQNTGIFREQEGTVGVSSNGSQILSIGSSGLAVTGNMSASESVWAKAGTAGSPGIAFWIDTNTGLYRIGEGNIGVSCDGTKILDISATGLGVIGSASTSSHLTVGGNLTVTGNVTVNGTTTTVNATTLTVDDPIITLGGDSAPVADDAKDRGIEFRWHNGFDPKVGFFGFDRSVRKFTLIDDATNTSEVFIGTAGTLVANLEGSVTGGVVIGSAITSTGNLAAGGVALLSNGTAGVPSYAFTSDPNTGIFREQEGTVGVSSNGSQILSISSSGLGVTGNMSASSAVWAKDGTTSSPGHAFWGETNTGLYRIGAGNIGVTLTGTKALDISATGLGVGNVAAAVKLHVKGAVGELSRIESTAASGNGFGWMGFHDAGGRKAYIGAGANNNTFYINADVGDIFLNTVAGKDIYLNQISAGGNKFITGDRNDGAITLTGGNKLGGGIILFGRTHGNYEGSVWISCDNATGGGTHDGTINFRPDNGTIAYGRFTRSGYFNVTADQANFNPGNAANTIQGQSLSPAYAWFCSSSDTPVYAQRLSDGNVLSFFRSNSNCGAISITTTTTTYNTSSDHRLKAVTGEVTDAESGTFIDALQPKRGTWIADGSAFCGFLAHEFQAVSPSSVTGEHNAVNDNGEPVYQAMQASSPEVIANMVAQIKSLRARMAIVEGGS